MTCQLLIWEAGTSTTNTGRTVDTGPLRETPQDAYDAFITSHLKYHLWGLNPIFVVRPEGQRTYLSSEVHAGHVELGDPTTRTNRLNVRKE